MSEQWRPIPGFPLYQVSDQGRVLSHRRRDPRILKPGTERFGYRYVQMYGKTYRVHCLVALAFIGERPLGQEIRHLDGNPGNNRLSNLAYGTRSENHLDAVAHGTHNHASKTRCAYGHELTADNVYIAPSKPRARQCRECRRIRSREFKRQARLARAQENAA